MSNGPTLVMHDTLQPLTFGLPPPAMTTPAPAPPPAEPELPTLELMCAMFPEVEKEVLAAVLVHYQGSVERAVASLLEEVDSHADADGALLNEAQEELDAQTAASLQEELDEETARALQRALGEEERLQPGRNVAGSNNPSRPSSANTNAARSLLARIRSRARVRTPTEASASLLGNETADSSAPTEEPLAPIYSPPMPMPPPTPTTSAGDAPVVGEAKYNSRVDRARAANRARGASTVSSPIMLQLPTSPVATPAAEAPPLAASGPAEGILI